MKIYVGTYRADRDMMIDCLQSITDYCDGDDDLVFIDDSGDNPFRLWLEDFGEVVPVGDAPKQGFYKAMAVATDHMKREDDDACAWWEEDFVAVAPIDLEEYADNLAHKLCQITFQRQPWFDVEKVLGVLGALEARTGCRVTRGPAEGGMDILWQQGQFSTNPGVWHPNAWRHGWPQCAGSEDEKTRYLVEDEQCFGLTPQVLVHHDGERSGRGY